MFAQDYFVTDTFLFFAKWLCLKKFFMHLTCCLSHLLKHKLLKCTI